MVGRLLAVCGWLAHLVSRAVPAAARPRMGRPVVLLVAGLLLVAAALPVVLPLLDPQPEDIAVQAIFDDRVTQPDGWVRLRGRVVPLTESPTGEDGGWSLLVDADNPLRAIVLRSDASLEATAATMVSGHLAPASAIVDEELPIEATVFGTPPRIVSDRILVVDERTKPVRSVLWPISVLPLLLATALVVGTRVGYPVFRRTTEVDVLTAPLGVGERIPAAWGGRLGPNEQPLTDPGGVLLLVRPGPKGKLLTAQPLVDDGPAPGPVVIGGSWTAGRIGYVHTISETVPALTVRAELVDATFLFARTAERDRVAALISVDR